MKENKVAFSLIIGAALGIIIGILTNSNIAILLSVGAGLGLLVSTFIIKK